MTHHQLPAMIIISCVLQYNGKHCKILPHVQSHWQTVFLATVGVMLLANENLMYHAIGEHHLNRMHFWQTTLDVSCYQKTTF